MNNEAQLFVNDIVTFIENYKQQIMNWKEEDSKLVRTYELKDFSAVINKLDEVARIANEMNHHPDFKVHGYNKISFELSTHDVNGVTEKDQELANKINNIFG